MELVREWAGSPRLFRLDYGRVCDLEEACDKTGIGAIYMRLGSSQYQAKYVYHTIRLALVGGGMSALDAEVLMRERFDQRPYFENAEVALDILITLMSGIEPPKDGEPAGDPAEPNAFAQAAAAFVKAGIPPESVRAMRYDDLVAIVRVLRADGKETADAPTEDEFIDMIMRHKAKQNGD